MIVRVKLFRANIKPIEHEDVQRLTFDGNMYIVHCKDHKIKYPFRNIWWIEEQETKTKPNIKTQRIRIDNDTIMEQDIKNG